MKDTRKAVSTAAASAVVTENNAFYKKEEGDVMRDIRTLAEETLLVPSGTVLPLAQFLMDYIPWYKMNFNNKQCVVLGCKTAITYDSMSDTYSTYIDLSEAYVDCDFLTGDLKLKVLFKDGEDGLLLIGAILLSTDVLHKRSDIVFKRYKLSDIDNNYEDFTLNSNSSNILDESFKNCFDSATPATKRLNIASCIYYSYLYLADHLDYEVDLDLLILDNYYDKNYGTLDCIELEDCEDTGLVATCYKYRPSEIGGRDIHGFMFTYCDDNTKALLNNWGISSETYTWRAKLTDDIEEDEFSQRSKEVRTVEKESLLVPSGTVLPLAQWMMDKIPWSEMSFNNRRYIAFGCKTMLTYDKKNGIYSSYINLSAAWVGGVKLSDDLKLKVFFKINYDDVLELIGAILLSKNKVYKRYRLSDIDGNTHDCFGLSTDRFNVPDKGWKRHLNRLSYATKTLNIASCIYYSYLYLSDYLKGCEEYQDSLLEDNYYDKNTGKISHFRIGCSAGIAYCCKRIPFEKDKNGKVINRHRGEFRGIEDMHMYPYQSSVFEAALDNWNIDNMIHLWSDEWTQSN